MMLQNAVSQLETDVLQILNGMVKYVSVTKATTWSMVNAYNASLDSYSMAHNAAELLNHLCVVQ